MSKNSNLHKAKKAKNDEFYTLLPDIENEVRNYKDFFSGKSVYCNCDHPTESNFPRYFLQRFEELGLERLIATCYVPGGRGWKGEKLKGGEYTVEQLEVDGDFRSEECVELLKESDVIVTNPPFSLFRDYVKQLIEYGKKFLVIGNKNAIVYKEIFPYIKSNQLWLGVDRPSYFAIPNGEVTKTISGLCRWFTNIELAPAGKPLVLEKHYSPEEYPKYDNYDAIEVSKVKDIPLDYDGVIGVPVTFLGKWCPDEWELIVPACGNSWKNYPDTLLALGFDPEQKYGGGLGTPILNCKAVYSRLFIKKKSQSSPILPI